MDQDKVVAVEQPVSVVLEKKGSSWLSFFLLGILFTLILSASAYGTWLLMGNSISLQSGNDKAEEEKTDSENEENDSVEFVDYEYSFEDRSFIDEEGFSGWKRTIAFKHPKDWVVKEEDIPPSEEDGTAYNGKVVVTATSPSGSEFRYEYLKIMGFGVETELDHCNEQFPNGDFEDLAILSNCVFIKDEEGKTQRARVIFNPEKPQSGVAFWQVSHEYVEEEEDKYSGYYFLFAHMSYMVKDDSDLQTLDSIALTADLDEVCIEKCEQ